MTSPTNNAAGSDRPLMVPGGAVLPPPPPGVRYVRLRWVCGGRAGRIVIADDELRAQVDRFFHWPMLVLALCVLPLLAIEMFILQGRPETEQVDLRWACLGALAIIWLAFVIEYIVKITIAECRIEYARRNWLDILIIVMPALRPLRIAYIAKTTRVFTLRGVGMKFMRLLFTFVLGMEATDRLLQRIGLKRTAGYKPTEQMTRHELMDEVKQLRRSIDAWRQWHQASDAHVRAQGYDPYAAPDPEQTRDNQPPAPAASSSVRDRIQSDGSCGSPSHS